MPDGTQITMRGLLQRLACTFWMKKRSIFPHTSKSAMTPSLSGRMAWMSCGQRPSIDLAALPTALAALLTALPTVLAAFPGAMSYERELEDVLGIKIQGLPPGRRYPLAEDFPVGQYPLRKDWKVDEFLAQQIPLMPEKK